MHAHTGYRASIHKNIALSGMGYWPRPKSEKKLKHPFKRWLWRLSIKTFAAILVLTLCNLVETTRTVAAQEVAKTAKEVYMEHQVTQIFPVNIK